MNSVRKLIKFLIDIFLLNMSLIISIFLKYDQMQMVDRNINFFIIENPCLTGIFLYKTKMNP